jgi:hypothetical protein
MLLTAAASPATWALELESESDGGIKGDSDSALAVLEWDLNLSPSSVRGISSAVGVTSRADSIPVGGA